MTDFWNDEETLAKQAEKNFGGDSSKDSADVGNVEKLGVEKNLIADETKLEDIRADIQIYHGVIPEKFETELKEINAWHSLRDCFIVRDFYSKYGFTEIEIYALRTGYDFENHELIFPLCENIFDKKIDDKIEYCKIKFKSNDFEPIDYRAAGVVVRYAQWFLMTYDLVEKFKIDDLKKGGLLKGILY